jgi:hypothetical protein
VSRQRSPRPAPERRAAEDWDRPIGCPSYRRGPGSARCTNYVTAGGCDLLDLVTCSEQPALTAPAPDLPSAPVALRPEDLASFQALGVEVCIESPTLGEIWLVPAYTRAERREITPEHAMKVAAIVRAFPGAQPNQWISLARER